MGAIGVEKGSSYNDKKPLLAEELSQHFSVEDLKLFGLHDAITQMCEHIRRWNGIPVN